MASNDTLIFLIKICYCSRCCGGSYKYLAIYCIWFPILKIKMQILLARIDQVYFISIFIWICVRRSSNAYNIIVPSLCWVYNIVILFTLDLLPYATLNWILNFFFFYIFIIFIINKQKFATFVRQQFCFCFSLEFVFIPF